MSDNPRVHNVGTGTGKVTMTQQHEILRVRYKRSLDSEEVGLSSGNRVRASTKKSLLDSFVNLIMKKER